MLIQNLINEHRLSFTESFCLYEVYAILTNNLYPNIVHPSNVLRL